MAAMAKTTSSSSVGSSESMSTVFYSCRILYVADVEDSFLGIFQNHPMSLQGVGSDMRYFVNSRQGRQCYRPSLDTCYLCKKNIHKLQDIYMYQGDLPFCSQECRLEQIQMDSGLDILYEDAIKTLKRNSVPLDQYICSTDKESCTESGFRNYAYNVLRNIISLVVG